MPGSKVTFYDGHLGFGLQEKNAGIFGRDQGAKCFIKGPKKSNQLSKHVSKRMVTELRLTMHSTHFIYGLYGVRHNG